MDPDERPRSASPSHRCDATRTATLDERLLISVVDDEESVQRAFARLLAALQFDVSVFASGEEFLESLAVRIPDCVMLDFQMPGLTARDIQRQLARREIRVPVIVVTAHDHPALRRQCLADGAAGYLVKPLRRDRLVRAIHAAVKSPAAQA